jgi:flagellar hook assembly protein FlgD
MLHQNYPNPFNPSTAISYELPAASAVTLTVHDNLGKEIITLATGTKSAGKHTVTWNGRDAHGIPVPSGVYYYRLRSSVTTLSQRMILQK